MRTKTGRHTRHIAAVLAVAATIVLLATAAGCGGEATGPGGPSKGGSIQVKGSDTMVNLAQMWAEKYM
ncbi:MAG: hypothetical protein AAB281_04525, partial [Actinomycetota bacterium]